MDTTAIVTELEVGTILIGLFGGLALFLSGLEQMTDALKTVAGGGMKHLIARLTTNRFRGALTGAFVTAVIQSSSVTTVLVVGFVSAGMMSLSQSIGIVMGANIGSTITAQIIAFKVTQYGLLMIAVGFGLRFVSKFEILQRYGGLVMGFGLIFFGMQVMSDSTATLRAYQPFIDGMQHMENPLMGILAGAVFTALVQSSAVTTGIVIVLASQGFITLEAGIALAFGANIGTCVTALLAAIGKSREALQVASVHVLFNILGVLLWVFFLGYLAEFVRMFSPVADGLEGAAKRAAETPRQIANAHSVFNVANTLIFIWFAGPLSRFIQYLVPTRPATQEEQVQPQFLSEVLLETPALALENARHEIHRLGEFALEMVAAAPHAVIQGDKKELQSVAKMDDHVDALHGAIVTFLGQLSKEELSSQETERLHRLLSSANYIENIGDTIETNLVGLGMDRLESNVQIDRATRERIQPLYDKVTWSVERSIVAVSTGDVAGAKEVIAAKDEISDLAHDIRVELLDALTGPDAAGPVTFRVEADLIENFKRVYYFSKRLAKAAVDIQAAVPDSA